MVDLAARLQNPQTIFYWPYVVASLVIALIWLILSGRKSLKQSFADLFCSKIWLSSSTWIDLQYSAMYLFFVRSLIVAIEAAVFVRVIKVTLSLASKVIPESLWIQTSSLTEGLAATIITMLAIDFSSYWVHRMMHLIPILWRVHATHHSARHLTPLTTYRQHILEPIILNSCRAAASGIALGVFHSIFIDATPVITVYGMGAGFFVYMFTTNLHHNHIPVRYPAFMRSILVSPHHHHIHHSSNPRHFDCNFGVVFSIWDRIFGTYHHEDIALGELKFGVVRSIAKIEL